MPGACPGSPQSHKIFKNPDKKQDLSHHGAGFEAEKWKEVSRIYRRAMGLALGRKKGKADIGGRSQTGVADRRSQTAATVTKDNETVLPDLRLAAMLRHRVRYLTPRPFRPSVQRTPPPEAGLIFFAKRLRLSRTGR